MPINSEAFVPSKIFQIGAGGSGSRICSEMCFFFRGNFQDLRNSTYTIIDHDRVSQSNLNRQLYFPHEGSVRTKGQILVDRYRDLFPIRQIPEPVNSDTITRIFSESVLQEKLLVIVAADNSLVVKQVLEHLMANARNDWLWLFTGANLVEVEIAGRSINTGTGQAYAYGKVNGQPLYPLPPSEVLVDIMQATGFGPSSSGLGCGVTSTSGAQTPVMNDSCASYTMQLINLFFEHGIFIPSIYFTDGVEVIYGDPVLVETLNRRVVPAVDNPPTNNVESEVPEAEVTQPSQTEVAPPPITVEGLPVDSLDSEPVPF